MDDLYVFCFVMYVSGSLDALFGCCLAERLEKHSLERSEVFRMFKKCVLLCSSGLITILFWYMQLKQGYKFCNCKLVCNRL